MISHNTRYYLAPSAPTSPKIFPYSSSINLLQPYVFPIRRKNVKDKFEQAISSRTLAPPLVVDRKAILQLAGHEFYNQQIANAQLRLTRMLQRKLLKSLQDLPVRSNTSIPDVTLKS